MKAGGASPRRGEEMKYIVRVNGRVFEESKTKERRDEIVEILRGFYPGATITATAKRQARK
jgi:hypothetical protein